MLSQNAKDQFEKLNLELPAIAIKFRYNAPEGVEHTEEVLSFCQFARLAQDTGKHFYIDKDNDNCCGKYALGMEPKPGSMAAGEAGPALGVFRSQAANAKLHNSYPTPVLGSIRYVEFCPVADCDFDPDLIFCVANIEQTDIIFRASSYISGDLWESRTSCVMSCAWTYSYPYLSGKMNFSTTGLHHGMRTRHVYPAGLHTITIPFNKIDEMVEAMEEMPWELPALSSDPEVRAKANEALKKLSDSSDGEFNLKA
ncbi:MAG: DUF169 domain-containing protein [Coriobacteriales bacterium]|jgi:uncharacterized protein (DUF169 family)